MARRAQEITPQRLHERLPLLPGRQGPLARIGRRGTGSILARWVVEAHGGEIAFENGSSQGCDFRMTLPEAQPNSKENR
jgi:signal transduction histidine kinase